MLWPGLLAAQEAGPPRITEVSVTGLKRTKQWVAEKPLQKFIGIETAALDPQEVRAAVLAEGILEPLEVDIVEEEGGWVLRVTVREKWSIFPLPIIKGDSGGWSFGGFFMDNNAFGMNDKFFAGGTYGSKAWLVAGGYMHTPMVTNMPGWGLSFSFSRQERRDTDPNALDLRVFNLDSIRGGGSLNFKLNDYLALSSGVSYSNKMLKDSEQAVNAPEESAQFLELSAGASFRRSSWDGFFLSEERVQTGYSWTAGFGAPSWHRISLMAGWEKSIVPGFRFVLKGGGAWAPEIPVLGESSPNEAQVNILPSSFVARHFAGASLGLEKHLFKFGFGSLSLFASWQAIWTEGSVLDARFDHGPAGGVSLYLSKIAIPALAVGAAYNAAADYFQLSFSLGMSF
ncbi:MAG: hypothetical protein LBC62_06265 [Treponema sp.]|jgi:hypothetical protein|nr:hypothetical protein [Treponema sp.]